MARVSIVDAAPGHIGMMLRTLEHDRRFANVDLRPILWRSYRNSLVRRTAFWDGEIAAMWGCSGVPLAGTGELWLCTNKIVDTFPTYFIKEVRKELPRIFALFPRVFGKVSTRYQTAADFLRYLGFTIEVGRDGAQYFWRSES